MCPASLFFWMQLVIRDIGANWHNKWRVKRRIPMSQVQRRKLGWLISWAWIIRSSLKITAISQIRFGLVRCRSCT